MILKAYRHLLICLIFYAKKLPENLKERGRTNGTAHRYCVFSTIPSCCHKQQERKLPNSCPQKSQPPPNGDGKSCSIGLEQWWLMSLAHQKVMLQKENVDNPCSFRCNDFRKRLDIAWITYMWKGDKRNVKVGRWDGVLWDVVSWMWSSYSTPKLIAVVITTTRLISYLGV